MLLALIHVLIQTKNRFNAHKNVLMITVSKNHAYLTALMLVENQNFVQYFNISANLVHALNHQIKYGVNSTTPITH